MPCKIARLGAALLGRNLPEDGQIGWLRPTLRIPVFQTVEIWNLKSRVYWCHGCHGCRMLSIVQFRVPRTRRRRQGPASQSLSEHNSYMHRRKMYLNVRKWPIMSSLATMLIATTYIIYHHISNYIKRFQHTTLDLKMLVGTTIQHRREAVLDQRWCWREDHLRTSSKRFKVLVITWGMKAVTCSDEASLIADVGIDFVIFFACNLMARWWVISR